MTQKELARLLVMPAPGASKLDLLNDRELEVISLLAQGNSFKQTAEEMGISAERLDELKKSIQNKLQLKNDLQIVQFAAKQSS